MSDGRNVIYHTDGSFEGTLCAVYAALAAKCRPAAVTDEEESLLPVFGENDTVTEPNKAQALLRAADGRIFAGASQKIWLCWLSDLPDRGLMIYDYVAFGLSHGRNTERLLAEPAVNAVEKAARRVNFESHRIKGFLRFSDCAGVLVAVIEPSCNVLPLVIGHFAGRYPSEQLLIFDRTRKLAAVSRFGETAVFKMEEFVPPEADPSESGFRILWKRFYDAVAIQERRNERCRMNHMPKRLWKNLTEMDTGNVLPERSPVQTITQPRAGEAALFSDINE